MGRGAGGGSRGKRSGGGRQKTFVEVETSMQKAEAAIVNDVTKEHGLLFDSNGNVVEKIEGDHYQILHNLPDNSYDLTFTHNHPVAASMSVEDVLTGRYYDKIRVVTVDSSGKNQRYSMSIRHSNPNFERIIKAEHKKAYAQADAFVMKQRASGKITVAEMVEMRSHRAWKIVAKKVKQQGINLNYKKESW